MPTLDLNCPDALRLLSAAFLDPKCDTVADVVKACAAHKAKCAKCGGR